MQLLIPAWDSCFWQQSPHMMCTHMHISMAWCKRDVMPLLLRCPFCIDGFVQKLNNSIAYNCDLNSFCINSSKSVYLCTALHLFSIIFLLAILWEICLMMMHFFPLSTCWLMVTKNHFNVKMFSYCYRKFHCGDKGGLITITSQFSH